MHLANHLPADDDSLNFERMGSKREYQADYYGWLQNHDLVYRQ